LKILIKDGQILCPGDVIASGNDLKEFEGTYINGENLCASMVSKASIKDDNIRLISLKGTYMPFEGDYVIGKVTDVNSPNWYFVDISSLMRLD
jgi:exosome complex RNA-binding protein Rrp4